MGMSDPELLTLFHDPFYRAPTPFGGAEATSTSGG